jgi:hypothetical protein
MEGLTEEQRTKLEALIRHLSSFTTPELIVTSHRIRITELTDQTIRRMRHAMGGAWACGKIGSYLTELRMINERRHEVGRTIHDLDIQYHQTSPDDIVSRNNILEEVNGLSGLQEVYFHQYAATVYTIRKLLTLVTESAGCEIPQGVRDTFNSYEPLRHYFEHIDRAAPGRDQNQFVATETRTDDEWRLIHGLSSDSEDRIVLGDDVIDVTNRGLETLGQAVREIHPLIRSSALQHVERYFIRNPEEIPNVEDVPFRRLVSTPFHNQP